MILDGNCTMCGKERGDYGKLTHEFRYSGGEHICWLRDAKCKDAALRELGNERDEARARVAELETALRILIDTAHEGVLDCDFVGPGWHLSSCPVSVARAALGKAKP